MHALLRFQYSLNGIVYGGKNIYKEYNGVYYTFLLLLLLQNPKNKMD